MLGRPLADVLELAEQRLRGNEVRLLEDEHRLRPHAPRVVLRRLLPALGPDRLPILEHRRGDAGDAPERLHEEIGTDQAARAANVLHND